MYISYGPFCNTIQCSDVLEDPLFMRNVNEFDIFLSLFFFNALWQPSSKESVRLTLIFCNASCGWGKVALLSTLLKASDVFFLFSADGNILSWNWRARATALQCKVRDEYAWLYKYCLCSPCIERRWGLCVCAVIRAEFIFREYEITICSCYVNSGKKKYRASHDQRVKIGGSG